MCKLLNSFNKYLIFFFYFVLKNEGKIKKKMKGKNHKIIVKLPIKYDFNFDF